MEIVWRIVFQPHWDMRFSRATEEWGGQTGNPPNERKRASWAVGRSGDRLTDCITNFQRFGPDRGDDRPRPKSIYLDKSSSNNVFSISDWEPFVFSPRRHFLCVPQLCGFLSIAPNFETAGMDGIITLLSSFPSNYQILPRRSLLLWDPPNRIRDPSVPLAAEPPLSGDFN